MSEPNAGARPGILSRKKTWIWLALYAALVAAVVVGMFQLRRVALATMDTPQARAQWQEWRESEPNRNEDLPVKRRPPKSEEPPTLVLMRDYFGVMTTAAVVFSSLLFAAIAFAAQGVLAKDDAYPGKRVER
jgi:hypothetical protein